MSMSRKRPHTLPRAEIVQYSSAQTVAVEIVRDNAREQRQSLAVANVKMVRQATPEKCVSTHRTEKRTRRLAVGHKPNLGKVNNGLDCVPDEIPNEA